MKVHVNNEMCQGHGRCYTVAPEIFTSDDLGYVDVHGTTEVPDNRADAARVAAEACPEGAIRILTDAPQV